MNVNESSSLNNVVIPRNDRIIFCFSSIFFDHKDQLTAIFCSRIASIDASA